MQGVNVQINKINKIRNGRGNIKNDTEEIQRIKIACHKSL